MAHLGKTLTTEQIWEDVLMETNGRKLVGMSLIISLVLLFSGVVYASSIGVINASEVNVRTQPDTSSNSLNRLDKNYILTVLESVGDWYRVRYSESEEGWVFARYIDVIDGIGSATVNATGLRLRAQASTQAGIVSTLGDGDELTVLEVGDGWYKVKTLSDATGWVSSDYVIANIFEDSYGYGVEPLGTGIITGDIVNVRQAPGSGKNPGSNNPVLFKVYQDEEVTVLTRGTDWYEIKTSDGQTGWVCGEFITVRNNTSSRGSIVAAAQARMSLRSRVVETAKSFLGTPYRWGGNGPNVFDCSGFTKYVMKMFKVELNRTSQQQAKQGKYVARSDLRPGDLIIFDKSHGHVGIYIGDGNFIHASGTQTRPDKVKIDSLTSSYYSGRYAMARNVLD